MTKKIVFLLATFAAAATLLSAQIDPSKITPKEAEAYNAILQAPDPDTKIKAVETLVTKFADSQLKPFALMMAAEAAQQKGDAINALIYAERTLEADPKNFQAMLMVAELVVTQTKENDLDKEEKLARVEKMANAAIAAVAAANKPNPQIPDDQWVAIKAELTTQGLDSLGLAAVLRKKYDVAIDTFKKAVEVSGGQHRAQARLASAYHEAGKYDDAIALADKLLAMPDLTPGIKPFIDGVKARATKAKAAK